VRRKRRETNGEKWGLGGEGGGLEKEEKGDKRRKMEIRRRMRGGGEV